MIIKRHLYVRITKIASAFILICLIFNDMVQKSPSRIDFSPILSFQSFTAIILIIVLILIADGLGLWLLLELLNIWLTTKRPNPVTNVINPNSVQEAHPALSTICLKMNTKGIQRLPLFLRKSTSPFNYFPNSIYIDNQVFANIDTVESIKLTLTPGEHTLSVWVDIFKSGFMGFLRTQVVIFTLKPNEVVYYELKSPFQPHLKYIVSTYAFCTLYLTRIFWFPKVLPSLGTFLHYYLRDKHSEGFWINFIYDAPLNFMIIVILLFLFRLFTKPEKFLYLEKIDTGETT